MCHKLYTVDRIEDGIAVLYGDDECKSDSYIDISATELPEGVKEGDILRFDTENNTYIIDKEKTEQVKEDLTERFKKLFKN